MEERLQKILSQWGIASRREAEAMILAGRVQCNGAVVKLGQKANPQADAITVDGKLIQPVHRPHLIYLLLHKPIAVVSTCDDPQRRPTVMHLLPPELAVGKGIHPVGRLDVDSTGALLLTNDGELTFALTHPRHSIPKTYHVWVQGRPPHSVLQKWRQGVVLEPALGVFLSHGKKTRPARVRVLKSSSSQTCLEIILREGRNRQIRRVAQQLGYPVLQLQRTAIGPIQLQPLGQPPLLEGCYRHLKDDELDLLPTAVALSGKEFNKI